MDEVHFSVTLIEEEREVKSKVPDCRKVAADDIRKDPNQEENSEAAGEILGLLGFKSKKSHQGGIIAGDKGSLHSIEAGFHVTENGLLALPKSLRENQGKKLTNETFQRTPGKKRGSNSCQRFLEN